MEHPVKEIRGVVEDLVQGSPEKQQNALYKYFSEDASFTHPFCHVPSFAYVHIPYLFTINSRWLILMIYRWYRILSPNIGMNIESTVQDQKANLLYIKMRQDFRLWFLPFYVAAVDFVVVLRIEERSVGPDGKVVPRSQSGDATTVGARRRHFIVAQEDHYQVGEWLKFLVPFFGYWAWHVWSLFATVLCVAGAFIGYPVTWWYSQPATPNHTQETNKQE